MLWTMVAAVKEVSVLDTLQHATVMLTAVFVMTVVVILIKRAKWVSTMYIYTCIRSNFHIIRTCRIIMALYIKV